MSKPRLSAGERREAYYAAKRDRAVEETSLPGKDGSTSSSEPETSELGTPSGPSPAPETEPSSNPDPTESGSADSADGGTPASRIKFYDSGEDK